MFLSQAGKCAWLFVMLLSECLRQSFIFQLLNVMAQKYTNIPKPELETHSMSHIYSLLDIYI